MSQTPEAESIAALVELHRGLERKGPGDPDYSRYILSTLNPALWPSPPRIADMGCGSGAGALLLAQHFQSRVRAVDLSSVFMDELKVRAQQKGLEHLIVPILGDMAQLNWPARSVDLIWSEGAAYNLGFEQFLLTWRSPLANHGWAIISELSWFTEHPPERAIAYWQMAYPAMGHESENCQRAQRAGYRVHATHRLPSLAWWNHYYEPLRERVQSIDVTSPNPFNNQSDNLLNHPSISPSAIQLVIHELEAEMALFEQCSDSYGYTFYVLQAS
ncbi:MAG: class I SAM-dependent methyltransferase [Oscillatoriales cyanobacterium SM2_2_1]|nr:class I SAM-dependent methyltransferase [Oscillatoriales cyanobacterium SM2_2_1]